VLGSSRVPATVPDVVVPNRVHRRSSGPISASRTRAISDEGKRKTTNADNPRIVDEATRTTASLLAAADRVSQVSHRAPGRRATGSLVIPLPPYPTPLPDYRSSDYLAFIGSIAGTKARDDDSSALRARPDRRGRALPDVDMPAGEGVQASIEGCAC
jgi:hypothetical protein